MSKMKIHSQRPRSQVAWAEKHWQVARTDNSSWEAQGKEATLGHSDQKSWCGSEHRTFSGFSIWSLTQQRNQWNVGNRSIWIDKPAQIKDWAFRTSGALLPDPAPSKKLQHTCSSGATILHFLSNYGSILLQQTSGKGLCLDYNRLWIFSGLEKAEDTNLGGTVWDCQVEGSY
jgi:hypothetical protein